MQYSRQKTDYNRKERRHAVLKDCVSYFMEDTFYCKYCGRKLDDDSLFCPRCGKPVRSETLGSNGVHPANEADLLKLAANPNKRYKRDENNRIMEENRAEPEPKPQKITTEEKPKAEDEASTSEPEMITRPDKPKIPPLRTPDGKIASARIGKKPVSMKPEQGRNPQSDAVKKLEMITVAGKPKIPPRIQPQKAAAGQKESTKAKEPIPHDPYYDDVLPDDVDAQIEKEKIDKILILKAAGIGAAALTFAVLMIYLVS